MTRDEHIARVRACIAAHGPEPERQNVGTNPEEFFFYWFGKNILPDSEDARVRYAFICCDRDGVYGVTSDRGTDMVENLPVEEDGDEASIVASLAIIREFIA